MEIMEVADTPLVPLRMSEKELTKGAKRILDDTEESGTRSWGEFRIFHHEEWVSTVVDSWDLSRA